MFIFIYLIHIPFMYITGGAQSIIFIIVGNGHGEMSSNPE